MMRTLALLLAAAVVQQTQQAQQARPPARRRAEPVTRSPANLAPSPHGADAPPLPVPKTAFDTTIGAIVEIGRAVADVKAEMDRFETASYNEASGAVMEYGAMFRAKCQELAAAARKGQRVMCRACIRGGAQLSVNQYRAYLPSLERLGTRCATTLQRLRGSADVSAASAALRRESHNITGFMVAGLRAYEARVSQVRQALGGSPPQPAPPRRGG